MTEPEVVMCPDGHFRRAVYELGPYIADYPEQVWLSGIVQGWCSRSLTFISHLIAIPALLTSRLDAMQTVMILMLPELINDPTRRLIFFSMRTALVYSGMIGVSEQT